MSARRINDLFGKPISVINVGLGSMAQSVQAQEMGRDALAALAKIGKYQHPPRPARAHKTKYTGILQVHHFHVAAYKGRVCLAHFNQTT